MIVDSPRAVVGDVSLAAMVADAMIEEQEVDKGRQRWASITVGPLSALSFLAEGAVVVKAERVAAVKAFVRATLGVNHLELYVVLLGQAQSAAATVARRVGINGSIPITRYCFLKLRT